LENIEIIQKLKLTASLLDLHQENEFKARSYNSAAYKLEKRQRDLQDHSLEELQKLDGVGKSIALIIHNLNQTGEFDLLADLLDKTPPGVLEMLNISGIGPRKIGKLWRDIAVETIPELLEACEQGQVANLKGFGEKAQDNIRESILYLLRNQGKSHLDQAEEIAEAILESLAMEIGESDISLAGDLRRRMEIINELDFVIGTTDLVKTMKKLDGLSLIEKNQVSSGPFCWRGKTKEISLPVFIWICHQQDFGKTLLKHTGSENHLAQPLGEGKNLFQVLEDIDSASELEIYQKNGLDYIEPELREGQFEIEMARQKKLPDLLEFEDLKGILHNHTTYSDGKNSLRQMAEAARDLGYQYLGINDHSVSAVYANGLEEDRIIKQHQEIDQLNREMTPFKIFKGIEADILAEGRLDYPDEILARFDFVITSIHSQTNMDEQKATNRLLNAIKNPFTTMLGHPTGRLLLRRKGYPLDFRKIIDACSENRVIIEINAHPYRLDLDWRWVNYALEKGVWISVNPDAHRIEGFQKMKYGVYVGRKGGLTRPQTFNCLTADEVENYFNQRREKALELAKANN